MPTAVKCQNCGAPMSDSEYCQVCGTIQNVGVLPESRRLRSKSLENKDTDPTAKFPYQLLPGEVVIGSYHPSRTAKMKFIKRRLLGILPFFFIILPSVSVLPPPPGTTGLLAYLYTAAYVLSAPIGAWAIGLYFELRRFNKRTYWLTNRRALIRYSPRSRLNHEISLDTISEPLLVMSTRTTSFQEMSVFFVERGTINTDGLDPLQPVAVSDIYRFYKKDVNTGGKTSIRQFARYYRKRAFASVSREEGESIVRSVLKVIKPSTQS